MARDVRFMYSGIRVRDLKRSVRFYRAIGFRVLKRGSFSHGGQWVHLVFPGAHHRIELNFYPEGTPFFEPFRTGTEFDHFGFYVADPNRWLRRVLRAGARPQIGFVDGPAQLVFVEDPDGVGMCACGPSSPGSLPSLFPPAAPGTRPRARGPARRKTSGRAKARRTK